MARGNLLRSGGVAGEPASLHRHDSSFVARVAALLLCWVERGRQRRALSALDDRLLRDIGVTPEEARRESTRPFWDGHLGPWSP
jgi:uncharacterized protein YjiS (DUF1127 family)